MVLESSIIELCEGSAYASHAAAVAYVFEWLERAAVWVMRVTCWEDLASGMDGMWT